MTTAQTIEEPLIAEAPNEPKPGGPPLRAMAHTTEDLQAWEETLWKDGCLVIRRALSKETCAFYLERLARIEREDPELFERTGGNRAALGMEFLDLAMLDPVYSLAKRILGSDMHLWLYTYHRMQKNKTISAWHPDDLFLVRPPHISDDVPFPPIIHTLNCHYYLVDVPLELGPTEVVPGSHRACRFVDPEKDGACPTWEGRGPISFTVEAGDVVIYSSQCWHQGGLISSDGVRHSLVPYYARRFIQQRGRQGNQGWMPPEFLQQCTPEQLELLGEHQTVPWTREDPRKFNMRWIDGLPVVPD